MLAMALARPIPIILQDELKGKASMGTAGEKTCQAKLFSIALSFCCKQIEKRTQLNFSRSHQLSHQNWVNYEPTGMARF